MDLAEAVRLVGASSRRTQARRAEIVRREAEIDAYFSDDEADPA